MALQVLGGGQQGCATKHDRFRPPLDPSERLRCLLWLYGIRRWCSVPNRLWCPRVARLQALQIRLHRRPCRWLRPELTFMNSRVRSRSIHRVSFLFIYTNILMSFYKRGYMRSEFLHRREREAEFWKFRKLTVFFWSELFNQLRRIIRAGSRVPFF